MQIRRFGQTAVVVAAAITSGCGLTGPEPSEASQRSGEVTVGGKSQSTKSVKCTQDQWALSIDATTEHGRARAYLQIGGVEPIVRTVSIENIDGLNGISGGDVGDATASVAGGNTYKITGTAVVSEPAKPGATTEMPFSIETPC
jgi:ipoprotein LpqH